MIPSQGNVATSFGCYVMKKKKSGIKVFPYSRRWIWIDPANEFIQYAAEKNCNLKTLVTRTVKLL